MRIPAIRRHSLLLLALAATACGGGLPPAADLTPQSDPSGVAALRPGDHVKVQVFGHEELSGEFPIDENQNLVLPVVGEFSVANMSVADLRARIRRELGQLYTQSLVTVTPLFRIAVLGEIERPGLFSVDPTMTIYDVLAQAGGARNDGDESQIRLLRGGQAFRVTLATEAVARATLRELGIRSGDQIVVPRKAWTAQSTGLLISLVTLVILTYTAFIK